MKSWKHWPYWFRGGVVGGGVIFAFVLSYYSCSILVSGYSAMLCGAFVILSPIYSTALLINSLGPVFNYSSGFAEAYAPIMSIPIWFILGSIIGALIGYIKKSR